MASTTNQRGIYINDGIRHPWRAFKIAAKRWLLGMAGEIQIAKAGSDGELAEDDIPTFLKQFQSAEIIPLKGVTFKVGKVVGGDFPALILVPTGITENRKLTVVRRFRAELKARHVD